MQPVGSFVPNTLPVQLLVSQEKLSSSRSFVELPSDTFTWMTFFVEPPWREIPIAMLPNALFEARALPMAPSSSNPLFPLAVAVLDRTTFPLALPNQKPKIALLAAVFHWSTLPLLATKNPWPLPIAALLIKVFFGLKTSKPILLLCTSTFLTWWPPLPPTPTPTSQLTTRPFLTTAPEPVMATLAPPPALPQFTVCPPRSTIVGPCTVRADPKQIRSPVSVTEPPGPTVSPQPTASAPEIPNSASASVSTPSMSVNLVRVMPCLLSWKRRRARPEAPTLREVHRDRPLEGTRTAGIPATDHAPSIWEHAARFVMGLLLERSRNGTASRRSLSTALWSYAD